MPYFGPNQYVVEGFSTSCTFDYISQDVYTRIIMLLMTFCGFVIPVIIISLSYISILFRISSHYDYLQIRIFKANELVSTSGDVPCKDATSINNYNHANDNDDSSIAIGNHLGLHELIMMKNINKTSSSSSLSSTAFPRKRIIHAISQFHHKNSTLKNSNTNISTSDSNYVQFLKAKKPTNNNNPIEIKILEMNNLNIKKLKYLTTTTTESPILAAYRKNHNKINKKNNSLSNNSLNKRNIYQTVFTTSLNDTIQRKRKMPLYKSELKVTKNSILIIAAFCISWLPYAIISLIAQFSTQREMFVTPQTTYIATLFAKSSVTFNPIIYALTNRKFKSKIKYYIFNMFKIRT